MRNYIILSLMVSCFLIITGCGGEGGLDLGPGGCVTAPDGSTIKPSKTAIDFNYGSTIPPGEDTDYVLYTVRNEGGIALSDVILNINFPWAFPSPNAVIKLWDGNTLKKAPMNVCTDVNGTYLLKVEYDGGCGINYHGDFDVWSGTVTADKVTLTLTGDECGT